MSELIQSVISLQTQQDKIRNISIIAPMDHGKTTLCDSLLAKGIISQEEAGDKHAMALRQQEKDCQITIKSLPFEKDKKNYIINLVDIPGQVNFSSEVTAALQITDGALIVIDCVEGVCGGQPETVTRQALTERIKPVLHINKVDRGILELKLTGEELYHRFNQLVESVNALLATYSEESLGEVVLDPKKGSVSFGSGKQGWAFTLPQFAEILSKKMKKDPLSILPHLWGDEYYDPETKKFINKPVSKSGKPLERYVVQTVFNPIIKIFGTILKGELDSLVNNMLPKIDIKLSEKEKQFEGGKLMKVVMQKWLPAADALFSMVIDHLPPPNVAQKYRVEKLIMGSKIVNVSSAYPISPMKFSVAPVVRRAVAPKNPAQLKKFTQGLKCLEKSDPCLQVIFSEHEFIIAGAGQLHIEVALGELQDMVGDDVPFTVSPPVVGFCETVTQLSSIVCLGKSPNKHNRLFFTAEPLGEKLAFALEKGKINLKDHKIMVQQLVENFDWDKHSASKIWFISGTNCLVDTSHGVQYLHEIKDSIKAAFEWVVNESVLCGESLHGVRFNLVDALLHTDTIHRGGGQIIPTAWRVLNAAILSATPHLVEPVYMAEIHDVVRLLKRLPRAFPHLVFDHWQVMDAERGYPVMVDVRKRKSMKDTLPVLDEYLDDFL